MTASYFRGPLRRRRRAALYGSPYSSKSNTHSPQHSFAFTDEDGEDNISADPTHSDPTILSDAEYLLHKKYIHYKAFFHWDLNLSCDIQ